MSNTSPSTRPRPRTSSDSSAGLGETAGPIMPPTQWRHYALLSSRMETSWPVDEVNAHRSKVGARTTKVNMAGVETRPVVVHYKHDCIGGQYISVTTWHRQKR